MDRNSVYQKLYNEHPDYMQLRQAKGEVYDKYVKDVRHWKLKYLERLIEEHMRIDDISHVVEIGCATGVLLDNFLKDQKMNKTGIDISDENIEAARSFYPHIEFSSQPFEQYAVDHADVRPDVIIMSDLLEHVENDVELLHISGKYAHYVLINLPIEKVPEYADREYGIDDIEGHLRAYSVADAEKMCRDAGMEIIGSIVKQYVREPIFRVNLLDKFREKFGKGADMLLKYTMELNEIEVNYKNYKLNYFALLRLNA